MTQTERMILGLALLAAMVFVLVHSMMPSVKFHVPIPHNDDQTTIDHSASVLATRANIPPLRSPCPPYNQITSRA